ncbi:DUF4097 family beta strand repeat protein [Limosilactobacillus sp. STM2_1]|uniref:DUF4097 family beta strand repeat protein n=1 Tax=Limosilactobacillus rudii TaxID=2759755 RepID=A0A7W3YP66_9LACO|nr:DUF4097 family beta strand repeat-containing protein [Limosilactobacillus rudii]MBB1080404.1 DUF4097 family beta strand repeat protein [Limosilactobacillus rudii]MBB1098430.1 DUF4097 family beta strand repeat protein [Limosilactobacillus rudii]MCD7135438.1 DUF4097 domain-containing protein [Limosilactobacillus rudii]
MKNVFKIGGVVLVVGLIILGIGFFNGGNKTVYFDGSRPRIVHNHVYHLSTNKSFERVDISASTANVVIREGKKYQVAYYGVGGHVPAATVHNQVASLRQTGGALYALNLNSYRDQDLIVITVPHDQPLAGQIHLDSGDLTVKDINLENAHVKVDSGDVDYQGVTLNNGQTSIQSGDFEGQQLTVYGHYTVKNDSGDNTVTNTTVDGYELQTDDGDNELNGEDKGSQTLTENTSATNVLKLVTQSGDNEVN